MITPGCRRTGEAVYHHGLVWVNEVIVYESIEQMSQRARQLATERSWYAAQDALGMLFSLLS